MGMNLLTRRWIRSPNNRASAQLSVRQEWPGAPDSKQGEMTNKEETFIWVGGWIVAVGYDNFFAKCFR
jgi:hypothetical protein